MPRMEGWKRDIYEGLRKENWSLSGPNRIVKVKPINSHVLASAGGFITTEQFLIGKSPVQIQNALGLQPGSLQNGCAIYRFTRLPMSSEYEYELTAFYPNGLAFNPADLEEALHQFNNKPSLQAGGVVPAYPPGCRFVHQWRLIDDLRLPVVLVCDLLPGQAYLQSHRWN